jgi:Family of unknown function (DUF5689)
MKFPRIPLLCLLGAFTLNSCVKQAFDNPPDTSSYDPYLTVHTTLAQLSQGAFGMPSGGFRTLGDTTIYGIVVADDRSGNIYKKIYIMDSSGGGMALILDKTYLYGDYPVGRKIYVKLNGLILANYKGSPEIVASVDALGNTSGIPSALVTKYIVKASYPHPVTPTLVDANDLFSNPYKYANTLVKLTGMQFDAVSANTFYSASSASTNRTITNCDGSVKMNMYNSSYATFQPAITPNGNGSVAGIISLYLSTPELVLRDTFDVRFTDPRCP